MSKNYNYKDIIESQLPHKVYKSDDIESNILGRTFDNLQKSTDELELNINPYTSLEEGVLSWEKFLKITVKNNDTLDVRRNRVLAAFLQYLGDESVITKEEMEGILRLYVNEVKVVENHSKYSFLVDYDINNYLSKGFDEKVLKDIIGEIKPSYLQYRLKSNLRMDNCKIFNAAAYTLSEMITIYPYAVKDIDEKKEFFIGATLGSITEVIEV